MKIELDSPGVDGDWAKVGKHIKDGDIVKIFYEGDSIQEEIDRLEAIGGGIIQFADGTHTPTSNPIQAQGKGIFSSKYEEHISL